MKKTLKEDNNRKILESRYINDNTLLEFTLEEDKVIVGVRYISGHISGIKEVILTTMSLEDYTNNLSNIIEENETKDAIAIYKKSKETDSYKLYSIFDLEEHSYAIQEFIDIVYSKKFPNKKLNKNLTRK